MVSPQTDEVQRSGCPSWMVSGTVGNRTGEEVADVAGV